VVASILQLFDADYFLFSSPFSIAYAVFFIWMLIDAIQNPRLDGTEKIVWVLVIIFLNWLGALIYYLLGRRR